MPGVARADEKDLPWAMTYFEVYIHRVHTNAMIQI